jgi:carbamate kinase
LVAVTGPLVVAVGGNALVAPDGADDVASERRRIRDACAALASVATPRGLAVTHGNGPQVATLERGDRAIDRRSPFPVLVAESQGHVGHLLRVGLAAALGRPVAVVLTHVEVNPTDSALDHPSKPVGDRTVASPEPRRIVESDAIAALLAAGQVVVCAGGGGIPLRPDGEPLDVPDAVVDKDLTSALLAVELDADRFVVLTDVDGVHLDWGSPASRAVPHATVSELRSRRFEPGTMGPKVEAACRFVDATGRPAHVGALQDAAEVLAGRSGTTVSPT